MRVHRLLLQLHLLGHLSQKHRYDQQSFRIVKEERRKRVQSASAERTSADTRLYHHVFPQVYVDAQIAQI